MTTIIVITILFFLAFFVGLVAIFAGYITIKESPAYHLKRRLLEMAENHDDRLPSDIAAKILRETTPIDRFLFKFKPIRKLDRLIDNAGLSIRVPIFIAIIILLAIVGGIVGVVFGKNIIFALVLPLLFVSFPLLYLKSKKKKRVRNFTEQFPEVLDMAARSLRAGHSLSSAIEMISKEMPEPVAGLFRTVYEEQSLGLSIKDSLSRMVNRVESMDLRLFVTAINIHRDVGGNLAEMLEGLATTIRERLKIRRQVRVYTAQGRLSGYILAVLPLAMAGILYFTAPDYLGELTEAEVGRYIIAIAVIFQLIGFLVIRKLINIRI